MDIEYVIPDMPFKRNGTIDLGGMDFERAHRFWREAVLDAHIPLTKIVGFRLHRLLDDTTQRRVNLAYRDTNYKQSYATICRILSDVIINDMESSKLLNSKVHEATMSNEADVSVDGKRRYNPLNTTWGYVKESYVTGVRDQKYEFMSPTETILEFAKNPKTEPIIDLLIRTGTGIFTQEDLVNSGCSADVANYFPVTAYYSIADYVRILPPMGDGVLRYVCDGILADYGNLFLNDTVGLWKFLIKNDSNVISKEDKEWLKQV